MNRDNRIRFGGLIVGCSNGAMYLGLLLNRHRGSQRSWRRCLRRAGLAFLPDQHTDQEDGQGNPNHSCWQGEGPMGLRRSDLVKFLEQFTCFEFSIVFVLESLDGHVNALSVGSAEEFCQLAGPIHGILLDLDSFGFHRQRSHEKKENPWPK